MRSGAKLANLLAASTDALDGLPVNVGRAVSIRKLAELISQALDIPIEPIARGEFRPGEIRHLTSGISRIAAAGFVPQVDFETGISRYLD
jgi:dTDP-L-rhamnose 4-epimerase